MGSFHLEHLLLHFLALVFFCRYLWKNGFLDYNWFDSDHADFGSGDGIF